MSDFGHYGVYQDPIVSRIEQFYLQESSKCLLGRYLKKLSSWEPANSGRRSPDSHSRGAHRYPYLGCSCIVDLEGQSDLFKSASVDRIERFWTLWSLPGSVYQDPLVSRIEQFYLQEPSKCLLGRYLKKLSCWEP